MQTPNPALAALRHHVSGAVERGEAEPIVEVPARRQLTTEEGQRMEREECEFKQLLYSTAWHGHAF